MKSLVRISLLILLVWGLARTAIYLLPGDPAEFLVHDSLVQLDPELLREKMGLPSSPLQRLFSLPGNQSLIRPEPAAGLVRSALLRSLVLALLAALWGVSLTFLFLFLRFRKGPGARVSSGFSLIFASMPVFVAGPLFLLFVPLPNPLLPALVLGTHLTAIWYRTLSVRMDQALLRSPIMGGRALGFPERRVFARQLLAPSLGGLFVFFGSQLGTLLNGSLLVEVLFQWNGLGQLLAESVLSRDYPLIELCILTAALLSLCAQQLGYLAQRWWDPTLP